MKKLLVVSLDAVSTGDLDLLTAYPNFHKLLRNGTLVKGVDSIFVTNTYPIHTSMITGQLPFQHGITDNCYFEFGKDSPNWRWYYHLIKTENAISQALKHNLRIATIFWPVMALAPVKYNIPEILARDHENQIAVVLKNSTKLFALKNFLRHSKGLKGSQQPFLDDFSVKVTTELLTKQQADLVFLHLTDTDSMKHEYGINSMQALDSLARMDKRIGELVMGAEDNYQLLILSDHAQVDCHDHLDLNQVTPFPGAWWQQSEGYAVLLEREKFQTEDFDHLKKWLESQDFFRRYLTQEEMASSGLAEVSRLGLTPRVGTAFTCDAHRHIGNHGFPLDTPDYHPFYFASGKDIKENEILDGGSVMMIANTILSMLQLPTLPAAQAADPRIFKKKLTKQSEILSV